MHPQTVLALAEHRRKEIKDAVAAGRRARRHLPRISVTWSGANLAHSRSVVIVISATR